MQKLPLLRFRICAWLCRTNGTWSVNDGRPKGLPYPIPEESLENRRGGACPSRGPVSDRPLREERTRLFIRRRGSPMWPPAVS